MQSNNSIEIRIYWLDQFPKKCNRCKKMNNSENTICCYCKNKFDFNHELRKFG